MERLTKRSGNGIGIYAEPSEEPTKWANNRHGVLQKLADYEDTGLEPQEVKSLYSANSNIVKFVMDNRELKNKYHTLLEMYDKMQNELKSYKDLEKKGLSIKLPCKVGDSVYFIMKEFDIIKESWKRNIDEYIVTETRGNKYNPLWYMASSEKCTHIDFHPSQIGKTVFLAKEEAEKELERLNKLEVEN